MLQVKYASKKIGQMDGAELSKWAKALLAKIHVITGWVIPSNEGLYHILLDQFKKTLEEKYSELNPDEIEFAFRNNGTGVEDWGKELNLNLIDKVLVAYLHDRYRLSATEEKIKDQETRGEYDLRKDVNWRSQVEENYQHFINGSKFFRKMMHPFEYDQLAEDGFFKKGLYKERFVMYQKKFLAEDQKLSEVAKERTVLQLFRMARKQGRLNLYVCESNI